LIIDPVLVRLALGLAKLPSVNNSSTQHCTSHNQSWNNSNKWTLPRTFFLALLQNALVLVVHMFDPDL
jgi:hypothetical protein